MRRPLVIFVGMLGLFAMAAAASADQPTDCDRLAGSPTDPNRVGAGIGLYGIEPDLAISACEKALAGDPNNPRLLFNLGRAHEARGAIEKQAEETARAGQNFKAAADQNYPAAQVALAAFYWFGLKGFAVDSGQAMGLLEKAMVSDATEAKLQRRNLFGDTTFALNPNEAEIRLVKEAADAGDADALYALSLPLNLGNNRKQELAEILHKAAARGSAPAAFELARLYFRGAGGLAKNPQESLRLIQQAMAGDDPFTWNMVAKAYERGDYGLPKDEMPTARLFKQGADAGDRYGLYGLGRYYEDGRGGLPRDPGEAARLYKLAADQGNEDAALALARYMAEGRGGYAADKAKAIAFLKRAARWSDRAKEELMKMGG